MQHSTAAAWQGITFTHDSTHMLTSRPGCSIARQTLKHRQTDGQTRHTNQEAINITRIVMIEEGEHSVGERHQKFSGKCCVLCERKGVERHLQSSIHTSRCALSLMPAAPQNPLPTQSLKLITYQILEQQYSHTYSCVLARK